MSFPRLTISRSNAGEVQVLMNPEARDRLIQLLQKLSPSNDHFHLQAVEDNNLLQLSEIPYREDDEVFSAVKVLLRLDEWDRKYFPHVMTHEDFKETQ